MKRKRIRRRPRNCGVIKCARQRAQACIEKRELSFVIAIPSLQSRTWQLERLVCLVERIERAIVGTASWDRKNRSTISVSTKLCAVRQITLMRRLFRTSSLLIARENGAALPVLYFSHFRGEMGWRPVRGVCEIRQHFSYTRITDCLPALGGSVFEAETYNGKWIKRNHSYQYLFIPLSHIAVLKSITFPHTARLICGAHSPDAPLKATKNCENLEVKIVADLKLVC